MESSGKVGVVDDDEAREVFCQESKGSPLRRKSSSLQHQPSVAPKRVHPVTTDTVGGALEKMTSECTKQKVNTVSAGKEREKSIVLQVSIALALIVCVAWTLWLIFLNIAPNDTVNRVMNTKTFDYGSFWLFIDPSKKLVVAAAFGLSVIVFGYLGVLFKMLPFWKDSKQSYLVYQILTTLVKKLEKAMDKKRGSVTSAARKLTSSLSDGSQAKKYTKLVMKFGDLALETVLLYQMLEAGSPAVLIGIITMIVASNALSCAIMLFVPYERAPMAEILVDILFDVLIVVGFPMLVVFYCLSTFTFDRTKFAINLEVFPAGWFEQGASVIADPVETSVIYKSLKSLRIMTVLDFFIRMGVNTTLCFRLHQVVDLIHHPKKRQGNVYPKRSRLAAIALVLFAVFLVVFVEESVRTSAAACRAHPECVMNARRWIRLESDSLTQCPCLILIDRDLAPKTYPEWEKPKNMTDKVAQLATTGDLQTLQLTNRYLAELPVELRRCKNLKHLSLEYTHTQTFPPWIKEFTKLEFLYVPIWHVESKFTSPMVLMPLDMFDDMPSLTFIHLAAFIPMTELPSLDGLTGLKSLTLAVFLALDKLPSFDKLQNLERLVLAVMPTINTLPELSALTNLKSFAAFDRGTWCCNGFISDCNLSDGKCGVHPVWGTPAATCLSPNRTDEIPSAATLEVLKKFAYSTCGPVLQPGMSEDPPTPETMAPCNGTLYRQCPTSDGVESMCYNARFMGITCTTNKYPIEMRRRQIARSVGDPCNPEVEAWLGCK